MATGSQKLRLDDQLSKEITQAVCNAMQTTFSVTVNPGQAEVGSGMVSLVGDVSGVIGLVQDELEGTMTICLTFETVRDILPRIVGNAISVTHEMTSRPWRNYKHDFGQIKTE